MRYTRLWFLIFPLLIFSCGHTPSREQKLTKAQLDQINSQISALEQSQAQIQARLKKLRGELEEIEKELEKNQTRIALSKSSLSVLYQLNEEKRGSWFEIFQNLGTIVEIVLLLVILWLIYWIREQSREQVQAQRAENILAQAKEQEEKEKGESGQ